MGIYLQGGTAAHDTWDGKTVRIAANKLDRLIAGSDDLLTTRLFITHRMQELEEMMTRFGIWRWNNALVSNDLHRIREVSFGIKKIPHFLRTLSSRCSGLSSSSSITGSS